MQSYSSGGASIGEILATFLIILAALTVLIILYFSVLRTINSVKTTLLTGREGGRSNFLPVMLCVVVGLSVIGLIVMAIRASAIGNGLYNSNMPDAIRYTIGYYVYSDALTVILSLTGMGIQILFAVMLFSYNRRTMPTQTYDAPPWAQQNTAPPWAQQNAAPPQTPQDHTEQ